MKFALTFNKPAVATFFDTSEAKALRVKVEDGVIYFKPTKRETGADVFPVEQRTRGGIGITLGGKFADQFVDQTHLERGDHMVLTPTAYNWIAAEYVEEKPSKIIPTARLWRQKEEMQSKALAAPEKVRRPRKPKAEQVDEAPARRGRKPKAEATAVKPKASVKRVKRTKAASQEAAAA